MTTAGPNSPGTLTDLGDGAAWADATNAAASDDTYANALVPAGSSSGNLRASNFGFAIPGGATIDQIKVEVEANAAAFGSSGLFIIVHLAIDSLGDSTDQIATALPPDELTSSDAIVTVDQDQSTWGTSLIPADINSASFAVDVAVYSTSATDTGASVDNIQVTITYTVGGATTIVVSHANLTYQGEPVTVDAKTVKPVVAAAMPYAGRAIAVNAKTAKAVAAAAMPYAGRAITVNAKTAKAVVAGAMAYAGAAVTVNAGKRVAVVAAAMAYAGQATRIAQRIVAGVGQVFYFGQIVSAGGAVAGAVAAGAQRLRLGGGFR